MRIIVQFENIEAIAPKIQELGGLMQIEKVSKLFPYVYGVTEEANIESIKAIQGVIKVFEDTGTIIQALTLNAPASLITLPAIKEKLNINKYNYTGKNIKIAVLDTGCDETISALNGKIISKHDVTGTGLIDSVGHGSAVSSCIVSNKIETDYGPLEGIAPDAQIISIKVFDNEGNGLISWFLQGLEVAVDQGADIINFSGGGDCGDGASPSEKACDVVSDLGIIICCAAGNEGRVCINIPGSSYKAIAVGGIKSDGTLSNFSSRGPTRDGRIKPDISCFAGNAYDEGIVLAVPPTSLLDGWFDGIQNGSEPLCGTSFSTPMITGIIALLQEAKGRRLKREEIEYIFMLSGTNTKNNLLGWGIPDFERAINSLNELGEITPIFQIKQSSAVGTAIALGAVGIIGTALVINHVRKKR